MEAVVEAVAEAVAKAGWQIVARVAPGRSDPGPE